MKKSEKNEKKRKKTKKKVKKVKNKRKKQKNIHEFRFASKQKLLNLLLHLLYTTWDEQPP